MIFLFSDINEEEFLSNLGEELIATSCSGCLERAFMCLGGDLKEFLTTLDGVHDVLKYQEDAEEADHEAAFICTTCEDYILLDFTTERPSVAYLLVGSLRALGRILYNTEVEITIAHSSEDSRNFRYNVHLLLFKFYYFVDLLWGITQPQRKTQAILFN